VPPPADEESHIEWQAAFCARGGQATTIDEVLAHPIGGLSVLGPSFGLMNTGDSVQPSGPPLSVKGHVVGLSGYDHLVFELIRGLGSLGIDLRVSPESQLKQGLVPPYFELLRRKRPEHVPELIIAPPPLLKGFNVHARSVVFTMWECDTIDPAWVRILNRAALIVVPSQWNAGRFRECGVTIPIEVVPLGHDPLVYHADDSFPTICTFGTAAALNAGGVRKNTQRLVELFHQAFPNETDVRLKVKITPSSRLQDCDDPRVEVIRTVLPPAELAAWYRSLSVFVSNSSGEGFGLHLIEAMACARAVIAPAYSGVTEYFDDTVGFVVPHHEIEARQWPYRGHWAEAEDEHLVAAMRRVYADMAWTRELGARSAARARRFTWKAAGQRLRTILSERGVLA
jgi:glycosyltransferase involved in cell wall biosynthesis